MSPVRACNTCGRPNCTRHGPARRPTRSYSNTAAYRAMVPAVLETYGDVCLYARTDDACPAVIDLQAPPSPDLELVLAHYPVAHADGGTFTLENLRPAHRGCNRRAGR